MFTVGAHGIRFQHEFQPGIRIGYDKRGIANFFDEFGESGVFPVVQKNGDSSLRLKEWFPDEAQMENYEEPSSAKPLVVWGGEVKCFPLPD